MRVYLYLLALIVSVSFVIGAPVINSHSGGLTQGSFVSISGSGFGVKSPVVPEYVSSFESGSESSLLTDVDSSWVPYNSYEVPRFQSIAARTGSLGLSNIADKAGFNAAVYSLSNFEDEVFISYWMNVDLWTDGRGCTSYKQSRIVSTLSNYNSPTSVLLARAPMSAGNLRLYSLYTFDGVDNEIDMRYVSFPTERWYRTSMYNKISTPGVANGETWVKIRSKMEPGYVGLVSTTGGTNIENRKLVDAAYNPDKVWLNLGGSECWNDQDFYMDDYYIDNTQARIELCENSDYSSSTHCEIQIPRSDWDNGLGNQITFEVNTGSFTQQEINDGLYLFVIDENGVVSDGYLVSNTAPFISSVNTPSGLVQGASASINGVNLGVKSPVAPVLWDDFESGALNSRIDSEGVWDVITDNLAIADQPIFSNNRAASGSQSAKVTSVKATVNGGPEEDYDYIWTNKLRIGDEPGLSDKAYVRFKSWHSLSGNPFGEAGEPRMWKRWRFSYFPNIDGSGRSGYDYPDFGTTWGSTGNYYFARDDTTNLVFTSNHESTFMTPNIWHSEEFKLKFDSSYGAFDGSVSLLVDDVEKIYQEGLDWMASGPGYSLGFVELTANILDNTYYPISVYYDDVYLDDTWQRIMLCDQAVWDETTSRRCEVQIPQNIWNDGNIEFEINLGSFTSEDDLWLFVIDENGVASNGLKIQSSTPYINNVDISSGIVDGASYAVEGLGFGTKSRSATLFYDDISSISEYQPYLSDNSIVPTRGCPTGGCEASPLVGACPTCPWDSHTYGYTPRFYVGPNSRYSDHPAYRASNLDNTASVKGFFARDFNINTPEGWTYLDWWIRSNHLLGEGPGGAVSGKTLRLWHHPNIVDQIVVADVPSSRLNYEMHGCLDSVVMNDYFSTFQANQWYHLGVLTHVSPSENKVWMFVDGKWVADLSDFCGDDGIYDYLRMVGYDPSIPENLHSDMEFLWGDVYFDDSRAKAILTDSPSFDLFSNSEPTHYEMQRITSWADNSVSINLDLGSFTQTDIDNGLYLYLVDEAGAVSNPYCISPSGCTFVPPTPVCGDGIINQASEECDGNALGSNSCVSEGFSSGSISCSVSCTLDVSQCITGCTSDGECNDGNECTVDSCDLNTNTCVNSAVPDTTTCTDSIACTTASQCFSGVCTPVTFDNNLCADNPYCNIKQCTNNGCEYSDCNLDANLQLYLPLNDDFNDLSVNNNQVVCDSNCPTQFSGRVQGSYSFDGTQNLTILDSNSLDLDQVTIAAWINPSSYSDDSRIISKETGQSNPYSIYSLLLSGTGEDKLNFRIGIDNVRYQVTSSQVIPLNTWTHIAATYDGTVMKLFINGIEQQETTSVSGLIQDNNNPVIVGNSQFYTRNFNGLVDEVRIYNRALSASEVEAIMDPVSVNPDNEFDLDNSGRVDIDDLYLLASYFGLTSSYDNTGDGKVNILDLIKMVANFT